MSRLEHQIERNLRQIADRATPSPNAWNSILTRIANQDPDTETEIIVLTETAPRSTRRWLPYASAAAAVILLVGAAVLVIAFNDQSADDDQSPSPVATVAPTTVPPTTVPPTTVPPRTATGSFSAMTDVPAVTFIVPDGWQSGSAAVYKAGPDRDANHLGIGSVGVSFTQVTNIYADPCQWVLVDPPVGPTVDDLISAWASVPGFNATAAVDVTVDGYVGKQIEFTVPHYEADVCQQNKFGLWQDDGPPATRTESQPNWWAQGPNQHNQLWILDVDGTRVVIDAFSFPEISPQDRNALDEILSSIQIG